MRARNEGCEAKKNSYHAGGSSSARFWIAQPPERGRAAGRVMGGSQRESIGSPFARARECEEQRTQHLRRDEHHRVDAHDAERTAPQLLALRRCRVGDEKERGAQELADRDEAPRILVHVVAELVRDDEFDFVFGEVSDQRVAEHDAVRVVRCR